MQEILDIFTRIAAIPHCSGRAEALRDYLVDFAEACGKTAATDAAGNVMVASPQSRVTLQCHYDMVCIGKAPEIATVIEAGWMRAEESSLGADNGMGVAIMLSLMQSGVGADYLFTNDEEIGLIGANNLDLEIRTPYLLNLDSEELGEIFIGCAGGEDLYASGPIARVMPAEPSDVYRITGSAPGGHSGVNIADDLPNAITLVSEAVVNNPAMQLIRMTGGERINAIPRRCEALASLPAGQEAVCKVEGVTMQKIEMSNRPYIRNGRQLAGWLFAFGHGVRAWNRDLDLPQSSINLAQVHADADEAACRVAMSARAMDNGDLARLVHQGRVGWEACGFSVRTEGKYPAWKPEVSEFAQLIRDVYAQEVPGAGYAAIHAGLECALFAIRETLQIASIGPTILEPHSDRERVDLDSVVAIAKIVRNVIEKLQHS